MVYDQRKEIEEAKIAVNNTLQYLYEARDYLKSASNWGLYDMLGGGFFSSMIKRGKMNNANKAVENARNSLVSLKKELTDINSVIDIDLNTNDFLDFADLFFDNFFVDWMVQSKIDNATKQVNEAIYKLNDLEHTLNNLI